MRLLQASLLVLLLAACQTTRSPSTTFAADNFPSDRWLARTIPSNDGQRTIFMCPEERCGERLVVAISDNTATKLSGASLEDVMRLRSIDATFVRDGLNLYTAHSSNGGPNVTFTSVRKVTGRDVGFDIEGQSMVGSQAVYLASRIRVAGNRSVGITAVAASAQSARRTLGRLRLPGLTQ